MKQVKDSKGRPVQITESHLEIGEQASVLAAEYLDTDNVEMIEVPESELEWIQERYQDSLYQDLWERKASDAYDRAKDFGKYGDS